MSGSHEERIAARDVGDWGAEEQTGSQQHPQNEMAHGWPPSAGADDVRVPASQQRGRPACSQRPFAGAAAVSRSRLGVAQSVGHALEKGVFYVSDDAGTTWVSVQPLCLSPDPDLRAG